MSRLIWSPPALRDVQRLYRFLGQKNPDAAKRRSGLAWRSSGTSQASAGRLPTWSLNTDFGASGYVAKYRHDGETSVVLAVRHQREVGYDH